VTAGGQVGNVTTIPVSFNLDQWAQAWAAGENIDSQGRTFGLSEITKGWNLRFGEGWCDDNNVCPSNPCPDGYFLDPASETCVTTVPIPSGCVPPCWLSCAPLLIQEAYCAVVDYALQYCTFTGLAECVALAENPEAAGACLSKLAATCTSSVLLQVINAIVSWFQLNPFGCAGCGGTPTPTGCVAPEYGPPCKQGDCFHADGCCAPCDPPEPFHTPSRAQAPLGEHAPQPADFSIRRSPTDGAFFVTNPHSREATIPVVPMPVPHPACSACAGEPEEAEMEM